MLQAAFRGHLARQKLLLNNRMHDAKSHKVIVGENGYPGIPLCLVYSVKYCTSRLNSLNHPVMF